MIGYDRYILEAQPHNDLVTQVYCLSDTLSRKNKTKKIQKDLKRKDASVSESPYFVTSAASAVFKDDEDVQYPKDLDKRYKKMGKNKTKATLAEDTYEEKPRNWGSIVKMYGDDDTTEVWDPDKGNGKRIFKGSTNKTHYLDTDNTRKRKNSYSPIQQEDINMYGDNDLKNSYLEQYSKENPDMSMSNEVTDNPKRHQFLRGARKNSYSPYSKEAHTVCDQNCCKCITKIVKFKSKKSEKQPKKRVRQENFKFEMKPRGNVIHPDISEDYNLSYANHSMNDYELNDKRNDVKIKKKRKPRNRVTCLCPEPKAVDSCPEGLCVEAVLQNKPDFTCKCTKQPIFPKECTDLTCSMQPTINNATTEVLSTNTFSSKTMVTIGKIKCLCRKYSQKVMSNRRRRKSKVKKKRDSDDQAQRNVCKEGTCREAEKQNINDFTCKCTVIKECTDETCKAKDDKINLHKNKAKKKLRVFNSKKKKVNIKQITYPGLKSDDKKHNNSEELENEIKNQCDQSGEPFFEMKVNYNNMCLLNPDEVNEKVKNMKEIIKKTCICPSHKRRKRHFLMKQTCRSGLCLKAFKNKKTNFSCTCIKPTTECVDSTCNKNYNLTGKSKQQELLNTLSKRADEPLLNVLVNPNNMCVVNKEHIFHTLKKIKKQKLEPCDIGVCREKKGKCITLFMKKSSFVCKCLNKKRKEEPTSCSELTCIKKKSSVDTAEEQTIEQPVVVTQSRFLSFCILKCKERQQRRRLEREAIKQGALLCKDKICVKPETFHKRNGIKFRVKRNELALCNCKECNKKKKKIIEKPKYQCGDVVCHDSIVKQIKGTEGSKKTRQVKILGRGGGMSGDGCRCCVCGKGPAECTCTCLSKILRARKYVCASISTLINTINTLRGRPSALPAPESDLKKKNMHVCECRKEMEKLKRKTKKNKTNKNKVKTKNKKKDMKDSTKKQKKFLSEDKKLEKSERKKRKLKEQREKKLHKQQIKDLQALSQGKEGTQETNCCADFFVGILKLGVNMVKSTLQIIFVVLTNPKAAYRYTKMRLMDPKGSCLRIKKWFKDFMYMKQMEVSKTLTGSETMVVLTDTFKDSAFYNAFSSKGRTKTERQKIELERKIRHRRVRRRRQEAIYSCRHTLLTTLRKTPCMWVYHLCPTFYPQCLSLLGFLRSFADILLFLAALIVWTPCIACCELCRACICCTVCAG